MEINKEDLFKFWLNNESDVCSYCKNVDNYNCETCSNYFRHYTKEEFENIVGLPLVDYDYTCQDLLASECPRVKDSICYQCIENNYVNFIYNGKKINEE